MMGVQFYLFGDEQDGSRVVGTRITLEERERGVPTDPTLILAEDVVQELFQDLWDAGYRPKSVGDPSIVQAHIKDLQTSYGDMRTIVHELLVQRRKPREQQ